MEVLFILEPMAKAIAIISMLVAVTSVIISIIGISEIFEEARDKEKAKQFKLLRKWGPIVLVISATTLVLVQPLTQPFEIYKKVLVYRGIESKTADKLVDNFNKLMDVSARKLEEWESKE